MHPALVKARGNPTRRSRPMYHLFVALLNPFLLGFLALLLATAALWRKSRRRARRRLWLTIVVLILTLICWPPIGYLALGSLEWAYPPSSDLPGDIDALVVLSGAIRVHDEAGKSTELESDTMFRCVHAARLYRRAGGCPVLVTGGKLDPDRPGPTLARAMADFLIDLGVNPADLLLEERSTTTYENAFYSCELLKKRGFKRVALATDAMHMFRASRCFHALGIEVVAAPCNYRAIRFEWSLRNFLPAPDAALAVGTAFHEWLGVAWYWMHGRI